MTLAHITEHRLGRGFVILAPPHEGLPPFSHMTYDPARHGRLLAEIQTLRGRAYLADGALDEAQLLPGGRHVQPVDDKSWHLLTVDDRGRVTAGIRYMAHRPGVSYSELAVSGAISHLPSNFTHKLRHAVEAELEKANDLGFTYVELGGWVVGEELRCSTEAIRMLLMMYALSQSLGGAIALSTATTRHNSSGILRRTGGRPLMVDGAEVPPYYDPHYGCEMEAVSFDSRLPNSRYSGWIREFKEALLQITMISAGPIENSTTGLLQLHSAVTGFGVPQHSEATVFDAVH